MDSPFTTNPLEAAAYKHGRPKNSFRLALRGKAAPKVSSATIIELSEKHRNILRLKQLGLKAKDIASELGCSPALVSQITKSEIGQAELARLNEQADVELIDIRKRIDALQGPALDLLEQVVKGEIKEAGVKLRVESARDLLDRGGNGKITKVEGRFAHGYMQLGIEEIKKRAAAVGLLPKVEVLQ